MLQIAANVQRCYDGRPVPKPKSRISVPISPEDLIELERQRKKLPLGEAAAARILLHYGISKAPEAFFDLLRDEKEGP